MAGIVFLANVLAFVLLVQWAFARRDSEGSDGETGLFGMRSSGDADPPAEERPTASWQRGRTATSGRRKPGWKR